MVPGGTTEAVAHFAGYLRIFTDGLRARTEYDDGASAQKPSDYVAKLPHYEPVYDLDPLPTQPIAPPMAQPIQAIVGHKIKSFKPNQKSPTDTDDTNKVVDGLPKVPFGGGGGGGSGELVVTATYADGGHQLLVEINQINVNFDNDMFGIAEQHAQSFNVDSDAAVDAMVAAANDVIPTEFALPVGSGTADVLDFITHHHAEIAAGPTEDASLSVMMGSAEQLTIIGGSGGNVAPGLYVNGEKQPEGTSAPQPPETVAPTYDVAVKGQWLEAGGNTAINAAVIVDLNEAAPTMVVLGDYFKTNAIVQTNSLVDNDHVESGGAGIGQLLSGQNETTNAAEFAQKASVYGQITGHFNGSQWDIEVVDGNFYDVRLLTQQNYLKDNDVTLQGQSTTHMQLVTGLNEQYNVIELEHSFDGYDMIVIGGSYHGANLIYQHNILLDSDALKMAWAGGDQPNQSAVTGQNALYNDARIANYGGDEIGTVPDGFGRLIDALNARDGTFDPDFGIYGPPSGSTLKVLYITGDYYDINAIWQVNVIADMDTAMQYLSGPLVDASGEPRANEQSIVTGQNKLINEAIIADVNSGTTLVGGHAYEDSILIQADIVSSDDDLIEMRDTNALVNEIIAFTDDGDDDNFGDLPPPVPVSQDDTMGSILH